MRSFCVSAFVAACCVSCAPLEDADLGTSLSVEEEQASCSADDARVGEPFALAEHFHGVRGTVTLVDDCTLELTDFDFDGGGLDVRAIVAADEDGLGDEGARVILSEDLRRVGGYEDASLRLPLPADVDVDDVGAFSIWCLPAAANLGHVVLQ